MRLTKFPLYGAPKDSRQYRLIYFISCELIIVCAIIIFLYTLSKLWYMVALIGIGCILALLNLAFLIRTRNTAFCGHILTSLTLLIVTMANYMIRGNMGTSYSIWFYVIPLLSVSLIGWSGLLVYSIFSLLMIVGFGVFSIHPFYHLPPHELAIIDWTNHLFAYLIIVTTLYSLMRENLHYEQEIKEKNYLLQVEKDKYHYLAWFDPLTDLPNRHYFKQQLSEIINSLAIDYRVTIFFMDLDNLKEINDVFGHEAGDHLLQQTALRLQHCFRQEDFIARLGGDEFIAIVLHEEREEIPEVIAQRIINEFNKITTFEKIEYSSSISIGLATYPDDAKTITDLMAKADVAMYAAKKARGSSYQKAALHE